MIEPRADRPTAITLGADKAYDEDFVNEMRSMNVTPHVAQNFSGRSSAIDGRTTVAVAMSSASASRKHSAGSRLSPDKRRPASVAVIASDESLPSLPPPESGTAPEADSGARLMATVPCFAKAFAGRWRIVKMDNWDSEFLHLLEEAYHL